ncbi:esterase/lipase family protein [Actinomadura gamaensis]|uniref:Esterase/lipase family protein n=1 Tax=Actinomadura gamaensis TaxID=1763541 RepID=A0ABV9U1C2_9ACTN
MRAREIRALGDLAGTGLGGVAARVQDLHESIADRVFTEVGPVSAPVRAAHDGIAGAVYASVAAALTAGGRAAGAIAAVRAGDDADADSVAEAPRGRVAQAILNAWCGDELDRSGSPLALAMTVRAEGRPVRLEPDALAEAHPDATGRVAVFLHGLSETEGAWSYKSTAHYGRPGVTFGRRLRDDLFYTPVYIRYNTGLRVHDNGLRLDELLTGLIEQWPVEVEELLLVGHSMGGLVVRSALAQSGSDWPTLVRHTVTLGSPHLGAPLERGAEYAARTLGRWRETRAVAAVIDARSGGIKDLRRGTLLAGEHRPVPLHEGARHFVVLATVASRPGSRLADLLGDGLVQPDSACGDTRDDHRMPFPDEHVRRLPRLHHFDLLNHPRVYECLHGWLADRDTAGDAASETA